jgi:hypothetical protein
VVKARRAASWWIRRHVSSRESGCGDGDGDGDGDASEGGEEVKT